jgi:uncharacterized membrane protein
MIHLNPFNIHHPQCTVPNMWFHALLVLFAVVSGACSVLGQRDSTSSWLVYSPTTSHCNLINSREIQYFPH